MILRVLLVCAIFLWFPSAYKRWTHSFRAAKCQLIWPYNPEWETPLPDASIRRTLDTPFTYLTKGAQSYVFLSADKKYVLKLFRFDACRIHMGQDLVRIFRQWMHLRKKEDLPLEVKASKTFLSCKLSYELASDLTGVVWAQLNPKSIGLPLLHLRDRLGRTHRIDPAKTRFVLQRRADLFVPSIKKASDPAPLIDSYLSLLSEFSRLGLVNLDPTMGRNFGFIDGRAVAIDIGNFALDSSHAQQNAEHFTHRLFGWLQKRRPDWADHFKQRGCLP